MMTTTKERELDDDERGTTMELSCASLAYLVSPLTFPFCFYWRRWSGRTDARARTGQTNERTDRAGREGLASQSLFFVTADRGGGGVTDKQTVLSAAITVDQAKFNDGSGRLTKEKQATVS